MIWILVLQITQSLADKIDYPSCISNLENYLQISVGTDQLKKTQVNNA